MEYKRKKLNDLFIINSEVFKKKDIYIWIRDDKEDIENMTCSLNHCVENNIYFCGFATDRESLVGLYVLNKRVYDINEIMNSHSLVLSEDVNNSFYCPVKLLNPKLNLSDIVIWGAGSNGRRIADYLKKRNISISYFIDSDQNKIGNKINETKIYGIEKMELFSRETSVIEASEKYIEIDKMIQQKAPDTDCYVYSHTERNRYFTPDRLMYLREVVRNKDIFIYGYSYTAKLLSRCLNILDYRFVGFLVEEFQYDDNSSDDAVLMMPEELLYYNNYFVIIVSDEKELSVNRLNALGLRYAVDFSPIETISYYLLYARKNIIDTNLGHTYKQKTGLDGIEIYGKEYSNNYKIVVLGGSTSDGKLFPFKSWPELLYDKIDDDGVVVYNAGVSGYTSAQELIKLIRDIVLLKPDMIIVYDGYNDTSEINARPGKYFEFIYLKKALDFAREHISHDWDFVSRIDDVESGSAIPIIGNLENWLMNIEMMHAIASDRGIKFYSFFQPMLSSKKNLTKEERGIMFEVENFCGLKKTSLMGKEFRNKINDIVKSHNYIYDLSHIFDDLPGMYMDICHVREDANEIIAMEILRRIELPF